MSQKSNQSVIVMISAVLAVAFAGYVGYSIFRPAPQQPASQVAGAAPSADPKPSELPPTSPTPAPPLATPAPEVPAPTPTAAAPAETPRVAEAPAPAAHEVRIVVSLLDQEAELPASAQVWATPLDERSPSEAYAEARQSRVLSTTSLSAIGQATLTLPAGGPWAVGLALFDTPLASQTEVGALEGGTEVKIEFPGLTPFEVRGAVLGDNRLGIADVALEGSWAPRGLAPELARTLPLSTQTDADGRFTSTLWAPGSASIGVKPGTLPAGLLHDGSTIALTHREFSSGRSYRVEFELQSACTLDVVATSPNGEPLSGATVELIPRRKSLPTISEKTGAEGEATLEGIYPENYDLVVSHAASNGAVLEGIRVPENDRVEVILQPLSSIAGTVSGPPGAAMVSLVGVIDGATVSTTTADSGSGAFQLAAVKPGRYHLVASLNAGDSAWYAEQVVNLGRGAALDGVELALLRLHRLAGELTGPEPEGGYSSLHVVGETSAPDRFEALPLVSGSALLRPTATISDSGSFMLENLFPDRDYLILVKNRESGAVLGSAVVEDYDRPVIIDTRGTGTIHGRIIAPDGTACTDSQVALTTGLAAIDGTRGQMQSRVATAGFDGRYSFPHVPVGQSRIHLAGEQAAQLVGLLPGQTVAIDFSCRPIVTVTLELKSESLTIGDGEMFIVVTQPGTEALRPVVEMTAASPRLSLEPGKYTITRSRTMDSRAFEVLPRSTGTIQIDFTEELSNF